MQDLSYLLGESSVPPSGTEDRQRFVAMALERAYRSYDFPFTKATATVSVASGIATLPAAIRQDSILDVRVLTSGANADNVYQQIPYEYQDNYAAGTYKYWLTGQEGTGTYLLNTSESGTPLLTIRYTTTTPSINASVTTPFPSSMCLARGALVYFRQAEDPNADLSQEEALFQKELEEVISQYNRSRPQRRGRSVHEAASTYPGDIGNF